MAKQESEMSALKWRAVLGWSAAAWLAAVTTMDQAADGRWYWFGGVFFTLAALSQVFAALKEPVT